MPFPPTLEISSRHLAYRSLLRQAFLTCRGVSNQQNYSVRNLMLNTIFRVEIDERTRQTPLRNYLLWNVRMAAWPQVGLGMHANARPARRAGPIVRLPRFRPSWADDGGPSTGSQSARRTSTWRSGAGSRAISVWPRPRERADQGNGVRPAPAVPGVAWGPVRATSSVTIHSEFIRTTLQPTQSSIATLRIGTVRAPVSASARVRPCPGRVPPTAWLASAHEYPVVAKPRRQ
jgi:hypothetical protein